MTRDESLVAGRVCAEWQCQACRTLIDWAPSCEPCPVCEGQASRLLWKVSLRAAWGL